MLDNTRKGNPTSGVEYTHVSPTKTGFALGGNKGFISFYGLGIIINY